VARELRISWVTEKGKVSMTQLREKSSRKSSDVITFIRQYQALLFQSKKLSPRYPFLFIKTPRRHFLNEPISAPRSEDHF